MINKTDEQLVADYLSGDEQAFSLLVSNYLKPIYNFIYRYLNNSSEAEDIAQDVFVRAWKNIKKFDQKKKFKTWLFAIAKNAALDWFKKKKTIPFTNFESDDGQNKLLDNLVDPEPLPSELLEKADLAKELEQILTQLPANYRPVLLLYYYEGFNLREIAETLNEPLDTIKSRHRRALILIRQLLIPPASG